MIRALIIEDELPAATRLQKMLSETAPDIIAEANTDSIQGSVRWLREHEHPDIIFLDIQLADGLCFEIFRHIKVDSFVVFTTAYDEYAIRAFELNSIDYLLKPVNRDMLVRAVNKFRTMQGRVRIDMHKLLDMIEKKRSAGKTRFVISVGHKIKSVEASAIAYFYSLEKSTFLCSDEGKSYPVDYSLDNLEKMVDPGMFFRVNRQYLVSFKAIGNILVLSGSRIRIDLKPAAEYDIYVSGARTSEFRKWLDK